jgi:hypothetical protein
MGFIKHALIGIALYEAIKYCLNKEDRGFDLLTEGVQDLSSERKLFRTEEVDIIGGARQADHLQRMRENAPFSESPPASARLVDDPEVSSPSPGNDLTQGTGPETPLTGKHADRAGDDPWKNSLANDDLRAPDS